MKSLLPLLLTLPLLGEDPKPTKNTLENLKLPGVTINVEEKAIDVTSSVCLHEGSLEFIACTKDTKEHESIIMVEAKPSHIHAALLLLGAKAGHPAMRKMIGEGENQRFIDLPPKGSPISVSLVITGEDGKQTERPISDFVSKIDYEADPDGEVVKDAGDRLKTFVFAGSHLYGKEDAPKTYLADNSGSVISLSTFGDELLCLPGVYEKLNQALQWEINSKHLPKIGTEVILRLRPQTQKEEPQK